MLEPPCFDGLSWGGHRPRHSVQGVSQATLCLGYLGETAGAIVSAARGSWDDPHQSHASRMAGAEVSVGQGALHRGHTGGIAGDEVSTSCQSWHWTTGMWMKRTWTRRSQVAPCQGHPGGWLELGWAWTRAFCTGSHLPGCQSCPGGMVGAEAEIGHRFPSVCHVT